MSGMIYIGIGCRKGALPDAMLDLLGECLRQAGPGLSVIAGLGTLSGKDDEPAIRAVADRLGLAVSVFSAARLEAETPRLLNPSDVVFREIGCHGVAEAAALALAGRDGHLVVPKRLGKGCTMALAFGAGCGES